MVISLTERARGCFIGLAVGDALGSPTEGKTPDEINKKWERITDFLTPEQCGSDDTEYALFSARILLEKQKDLTSEDVAAAWKQFIAKPDHAYKGAGFSELLTINNLLNGINPPQSGKHLHAWSDGLAMRVAPYGIAAAGNPSLAAKLAGIDGSVSHSGEGIYCGQAVAAAVSSAMNGDNLETIINTALVSVPKDSWTFNSISHAVKIGFDSNDVWSALNPLFSAIACTYYFWPDMAPEACGLAFGIIAASKVVFEDAVLGAVNIGRDTDTIAGIAGAICGAMNGESSIPGKWKERISVSRGICISTVKEMSIPETADKLALLAESWREHE